MRQGYLMKGFLIFCGLVIGLVVLSVGIPVVGMVALGMGINNFLIFSALVCGYIAFRMVFQPRFLTTKRRKQVFYSVFGLVVLFLAFVPIGG